uniref:ACB domain-containing protein n=1 Tax=Myripristis murdjan TaxID=586833 RepID=A0A667WP16_9TELE
MHIYKFYYGYFICVINLYQHISTDRPGFPDFKGRGKWDAWNAKKGLSQEEAMASYISFVEEMIQKYGM